MMWKPEEKKSTGKVGRTCSWEKIVKKFRLMKKLEMMCGVFMRSRKKPAETGCFKRENELSASTKRVGNLD
jgi:hypothetical protein